MQTASTPLMVVGVSCTAWASSAIIMTVVRVKRLAVAAIRKKRMFKSPWTPLRPV